MSESGDAFIVKFQGDMFYQSHFYGIIFLQSTFLGTEFKETPWKFQ